MSTLNLFVYIVAIITEFANQLSIPGNTVETILSQNPIILKHLYHISDFRVLNVLVLEGI